MSEREAKVMSCAVTAKEPNDVTSEHEDILFSVFSRFEMRSAPVWGTQVQEQLVKLARYIFLFSDHCVCLSGW